MPAPDLRSGLTRGESPAFRPGSPFHDQDAEGLGLALVGVVNLTPDLAIRELRGMDVRVRHAGAHRPHEFDELARRNPLADRSADVSGGDGPGDHALLRAIRLAPAAAEERGYAARGEAVAEVNMGKEYRSFEAAVRERVIDRLRVLVDGSLERAGRHRGDTRRGGLLVPGHWIRLQHRLVALGAKSAHDDNRVD